MAAPAGGGGGGGGAGATGVLLEEAGKSGRHIALHPVGRFGVGSITSPRRRTTTAP